MSLIHVNNVKLQTHFTKQWFHVENFSFIFAFHKSLNFHTTRQKNNQTTTTTPKPNSLRLQINVLVKKRKNVKSTQQYTIFRPYSIFTSIHSHLFMCLHQHFHTNIYIRLEVSFVFPSLFFLLLHNNATT